MRPKKLCNCVVFSGAGISLMAVALSGSGRLSSLSMMCPEYFILSRKNSHLFFNLEIKSSVADEHDSAFLQNVDIGIN